MNIEHVMVVFILITNCVGEELKCSQYTLCNSCTEKKGGDFRPVARGCVWCEDVFASRCISASSPNCTMSNRKTFGNCGFSWIPIIIIFFVFGLLFFVYGIFIVIIKRIEYKSYESIMKKNNAVIRINSEE